VVRLLPRAEEDPGQLAAVRLAGPYREAFLHTDLYEAIWRRHTSRMPFASDPVPRTVIAELAEAARLQGVELRPPTDDWEAAQILALTREGELRNTTDSARSAERRSWITAGDRPDGIPESALGPLDAEGRMPVRDFPGLRHGPHLPRKPFEPHPQLLLLATRGDGSTDWLRAGQALEHILLLLTVYGLRSSIMYQAIEWPDLRWLLRDTRSGPSAPQILLRIGYGPEGPQTPRRAVAGSLLEPPALPARD
jgi:hypothetical protein